MDIVGPWRAVAAFLGGNFEFKPWGRGGSTACPKLPCLTGLWGYQKKVTKLGREVN